MRIENLPYASLANTKYTCCSDKTLVIRDSKNSPARTCHRLPVLQISGRYQCRISSRSLAPPNELRKWFSSATTWRSRSPLLFILNASYHNGIALFCRCPIKKEILLLAALIILAATDGKRDSPCLPDPSWPSSIFGIRPHPPSTEKTVKTFYLSPASSTLHFLRLHSGAINHFDSETPVAPISIYVS